MWYFSWALECNEIRGLRLFVAVLGYCSSIEVSDGMVIAGCSVREEEREAGYEAIDACFLASVCRK